MQRFLFFCLVLLGGASLHAQQIAGTYTMTFDRGTQVFTDRTPVNETFSGTATMTITQNGDEVTVTVGNYGGEWSTHRQSGRVGNNRLVTGLASGDKSMYLITARVEGSVIKGEFLYLRYGDGNSGIVPGWTRVRFTAQ
ncbi:MAG: hypothetical protein D6722_25680 [Bacteroidetes bacterium]|nr:MAG: hypothetical protein D6722_25680 [Bacteroidota bacterium]